MVLTLRRSAYSTNIKTRADFSCAFFDARAARGRAGLHPARPPRLDGRAGAARGPRLRRREPRPRRRDRHQRPVPERRPPQRRHADLAGPSRAASCSATSRTSRTTSTSAAARRRRSARSARSSRRASSSRRSSSSRAAQIVDDVFALVLAQIRSKHETAGDLRAQIAANATGVRRLAGARRRGTGRDDRRARWTSCSPTPSGARAPSSRRCRTASSRPRARSTPTATPTSRCGCARGSRSTPDGVAFDLAGSDPQRRAPVNSTYAQTFSACAYALKCLIDPDLPVNDGFYRLVRGRRARRARVVNCTWPRPVVGGWETQTRLVDVIFRALLPGAARAAARGDEGDDVPRGLRRRRPGDGRVLLLPRDVRRRLRRPGSRATGPDAVQTHGQNTENAPVEETELNYPVRIDAALARRGLRRRRAGSAAASGCARTTASTGRRRSRCSPTGRWPARGARSAATPARRASTCSSATARSAARPEERPSSSQAGDVVSYRTCGGGGYGPPDGARPGARAARRARGQGERRARARRLRRRDRRSRG